MVLRDKRSGLEEKFYTLCQKVVVEAGSALYDVDYNGSSCLLRVFIYQPQTMTADLGDCVRVDEALTPHFEQESWVPENVRLEVSSPGVFRFLRQVQHFEWAKGKMIKLKLTASLPDNLSALVKNKGAKLRGKLLEASEEGIRIEIESKEGLISVDVGYSQIKQADLDPDLDKIV